MQIDAGLLGQCWFLTGPTACGKSSAGLVLAERLNAEIVSLDSMSLYRGMDIGTAKPTKDEQQRIPHRLIDILDPSEDYSVAEYLIAAGRICAEIIGHGKVPLFVGGTGLYLRALLRGVFEGPEADWDLRRALEREAADSPAGYLHEKLRVVDAAAAARLHPHDLRRIIRALEVYHLTGRPASEQQSQQPLPEALRPKHVYWLSPPRDWLYARIDHRVVQMITAGWVEEARNLLSQTPPLSRTAYRALGYDVLFEHLQGRHTLEDAIALIQTRTRQFAKRQHTWFRNLVECHAVNIDGTESPQQIADGLLSR